MMSELEKDLLLARLGDYPGAAGSKRIAAAYDAIAALSEDECAICGKPLKQHSMSSGYGVCQIYPVFVSKRQMVERLLSSK